MRLLCSCCGTTFKGDHDPRHDTGFGVCQPCEASEQERIRGENDKSIKLIANALNEQNKAKFLAEPRWLQLHIVQKAFEEGVLKWQIN